MNFVTMTGRLTKDPESRVYGNDNKTMVNFSLAVNRSYGGKDKTADFFNCTAFGGTATVIEKYCLKGSFILIEGEVQNNNYKGKDGNTVYGTKILVNRIEFLQSKAEAQAERETQQASVDDFMSIPDGDMDELPFN